MVLGTITGKGVKKKPGMVIFARRKLEDTKRERGGAAGVLRESWLESRGTGTKKGAKSHNNKKMIVKEERGRQRESVAEPKT